MNTPDNNRPGREETTPAISTPKNYQNYDSSFTLQMIMELQKSVGQVSESTSQLNRRFDGLDGKINNLETSMSSVKITIAVASILLAIIITISGFFVDKAWDSVVNHIDISVKK